MIFKEHEFIKKEDLPKKVFESLKTFASFEENHKYIDLAKGGNALRLKNFVGTITTKENFTIEILPKIYGINEEKEVKEVLFKMLKTLKNSPFKKINKSNLQSSNFHIFEIFIQMFLEELTELVKKGIKSEYVSKKENTSYLKGKLQLSSHLRKNLLNKEKFYIEFDEYMIDRAENRLIKTTLEKLYKVSKSSANKQRLREFVFTFEEVKISKDIEKDFKKCKLDRSMKIYEQILQWCQIFLNNQSFNPYKGSDLVYACLFDMNLLFESYIANYFKKEYKTRSIKTQDKKYKLLEQPKIFQLRPDIVFDEKLILDTKWKLINSSEKKLGLSQSDLYQMYAYGKKYNVRDVYLIYPKSEKFQNSLNESLKYDYSLNLHVLCFDCFNVDKQDFIIDDQ